jgi:homoprotocatechuate degradation regulator HpaR
MRKFSRSLPMALLRARESAMAYFRPLLNAYGVTEQQWRVIRVLKELGEIEFRELSDLSCIQPPSLTGVLTRLEAQSLVRRKRSATDQRRLHVSLTRKGLARYAALSDQLEARYRVLEKQLGRTRFKTLMGVLAELSALAAPAAPISSGRAVAARKPSRR